MRALEHAIVLHQIHTLQGHVQPRVVGVLEEHELAAMAPGCNLPESFELPDAVVHVHNKIAGF